MIKALKQTTYITSYVVIAWLALSYFEIVCKNLTNPVYSNFNLIVLLFENFNQLLLGGIF